MGTRIRKATPAEVFSQWFQMIEGLSVSPSDFYDSVETYVQKHQIPDIRMFRVTRKEGGVFSANRIYLRVIRKGKIFDICGAPFGSGFFVSWWLGDKPANPFVQIGRLLAFIPLIGMPFHSLVITTHYKIDTMLMFQQSVHSAVIDAVDEVVKGNGLKPLSEDDKKPTMLL